MIAAVLAGGQVVATAQLRRLVAAAELVVAADGGARHARHLGVEPHLIVGDLDSIEDVTLRRHPTAEVRRHPPDKELLDLELALDEVAARGATRVLLVGAFGGRHDHAAAVLAIAAARHAEGLEIELHGGDALAYPVRSGERRALDLPPGTLVSLLAERPGTRVTLERMRFEITDGPLEPASGRGLSNVVAAAGAAVTVLAGGAMVFVPQLPVAAAEVIWGAHAGRIEAGLRALDAELGELVHGVAYERVFGDAALDLRTRELLSLALLIGSGGAGDLRTHLYGALRAGATPEELHATIRHAAMFVGFPAALAAARALREVLEPRGGG